LYSKLETRNYNTPPSGEAGESNLVALWPKSASVVVVTHKQKKKIVERYNNILADDEEELLYLYEILGFLSTFGQHILHNG